MRKYCKRVCFILLLILIIPYGITKVASRYLKEKNNTIENISIMVDEGKQKSLYDLNTYIIMVLAAVSSPDYELEAIKAQACIIRTYIYTISKEKKTLSADQLGLMYYPVDKIKVIWGEDKKGYINKLDEAIKQTASKVIMYKEQPIVPLYHPVSTGVTRDVRSVVNKSIPYLVSVESKEDVESRDYLLIKKFTKADLVSKICAYFPDCNFEESMLPGGINEIDRAEDGYVNKMLINNISITGEQFSECLNLNSTNFYIEDFEEEIRVICKGKGHGIGLSQFGANQMAKHGYDYIEILEYYYRGTQVQDWIK